ncbi:hypothetical protein A6M21_00410 [Desulfotomaculum copahuensis]|uniref:Uncharacterized protein n=1 Tax=Desulfotomaculum copahuensis TaxID=1838280 RepID=A0A1B7LDX1_9FIRM|nr:hypothetical protein A6M21_00410 [Desulfotomaculum copahuensis]
MLVIDKRPAKSDQNWTGSRIFDSRGGRESVWGRVFARRFCRVASASKEIQGEREMVFTG